ncbi:hypothetical protein COBT_001812 [Conglomerata obtusa]
MKINIYTLNMLYIIFRKRNYVNAHTVESIYESLRSYQNDIIEKEKQHLLKQENNEFIFFEYEASSIDDEMYIQNIFEQILHGYCELKKISK